MVAVGDSLATILTCGEWSPKAILSNVDDSAVDASRLFAQTIQASDSEDDACEADQLVNYRCFDGCCFRD